jgi:hypothetical protein
MWPSSQNTMSPGWICDSLTGDTSVFHIELVEALILAVHWQLPSLPQW